MSPTNKYHFRDIKIDDLQLNLQYPRLPKSKQGIDESEVIKFMLLESATLELMLAIGGNGYFPGEQLLVVKNYKLEEVI